MTNYTHILDLAKAADPLADGPLPESRTEGWLQRRWPTSDRWRGYRESARV